MQFGSRLIAPAADVAALVNTFYYIETAAEQIADVMPAYSAQLVLHLSGHLCITYSDASTACSQPISVYAPQLRSAAGVMKGPARLIGASLTPLGWQALGNRPVDEVHDQLIPAGEVLTPEQIALLEDAAAIGTSSTASAEDICTHLAAVIRSARFAPRPDHVAVVEAIGRWLGSSFDPPLADLHAAVTVSPRQLQRISRRFYGVPPAQVLKRYRAIRAAMLLANPDLSRDLRDEMMATYFDQAHLIRDIRRYTGLTPKRLRAETLSRGLLDPFGHGASAALLRTAPA